MSSETQSSHLLKRIPFTLIFAVYLGYLALDYQSFTSDSKSPLVSKVNRIQSLKKENQELKAKQAEAEKFQAALEYKKSELRNLASKLDGMKTSLGGDIDIPTFVKLIITEARKVGIKVVSLKPSQTTNQNFYAAQSFDLNLRGVYLQFLTFMDRISNVQRLVRVEQFQVKPIGPASSKYVELDGVIQIQVFRYLPTQEGGAI